MSSSPPSSSTIQMPSLRVLTAAIKLDEPTLARLRSRFPVVHYHPPPQQLPAAVAAETDVIFCTGRGLPPNVTSIGSTGATQKADGQEVHLSRVQHVQLGSAGANKMLEHAAIKRYAADKGEDVSISTASGTHVLSIPPWVVGQLIGCWQQFSRMYDIQRVCLSRDHADEQNKQSWAEGEEVDRNGSKYYARSLKGRTVGLLGYGALGRETARLLQAFGMRILACNTSGERTEQDGVSVSLSSAMSKGTGKSLETLTGSTSYPAPVIHPPGSPSGSTAPAILLPWKHSSRNVTSWSRVCRVRMPLQV